MNFVQMSRSVRLRLSIVQGESFSCPIRQYGHGDGPIASGPNPRIMVRTGSAGLGLAITALPLPANA
jgi:hypothetical protein